MVEGRAVERLVGGDEDGGGAAGWLVDVPFPLIKPPRIRKKGKEKRGGNRPHSLRPHAPSTWSSSGKRLEKKDGVEGVEGRASRGIRRSH